MEAWQNWAEQLKAYLDCPCQVIAPQHDGEALQEMYERSRDKGRQEGSTPVWVVVSDTLLEALWNGAGCLGEKDLAAVRRYREQMLKKDIPDGQRFLAERASLLRQELEADGADWEADFLGDNEEDSWDELEGIGVCFAQVPLLLAEIPTDQPWQIPAWLPFGGFQECPDNEALMAVARYWYERYGAVIAAVSYDTLTFLASPIKEAALAEELAIEQFAFNYETVETIRTLAAKLRSSTVWDFWWD